MERKPLLQDSDKEYNTFMNSSGHDHRRHGAMGTESNVNNANKIQHSCVQEIGSSDVSRGTAACDLPSTSDSHNSNIKARNNGPSRRSPDGHQERRLRSPCQDFNESENSVSEDAQKVHAEDGEVIKNQKTRMFLLVLIGFLASCGSKIYAPVITQYTYQVYTEQVFGNLSAGVHVSKQPCVNSSDTLTSSDTQQVQDQSGDFLSRITLIGGGVAIFTNLFLGSYSDVMGRKLVLLLPIFGHFLRYAALPIIIYFDLGLPGMYVGYLLDGLFGGFSGIMLGLYVYTADITKTGGQRTMSLALVEMSIGLGQCSLNVVAGLFIEEMGFFYPSLAASSLVLVCVFLICLLPETVPRDRKKMISPIKSFQRVIGTFLPRDNVYRRAMLLVVITAFFIATLPVYCTETLESLYLMDRPFCWSALQQGIFGTAKDTSNYLVGVTMIRLLNNVISMPLMTIIGLLSDIATNVVMALAYNDLTVYMAVVAGLLRRLVYPALRSFMSGLVPRERQGALFAGIAVLESACICLGLVIFANVYKVTMPFMSGFVFLTIAAVDVIVIALMMIDYCLLQKFKATKVIVMSVQAEDEEQHHQNEPDIS